MAIVHADNFSMYGATASYMLDGVYAQLGDNAAIVADPDGLSAGHVFQHGWGVDNTYNLAARFVLPSAQSTVGVAQRVWLPGLPTSSTAYPILISLRNSSNSAIATLKVETTGQLTLINGVASESYTTNNPAITANAWWHIELWVTQDSTAGTYEVRVEGVTVLSGDTKNFGSSPIAQISIATQENFSTTYGYKQYHKDLVVADGTGSQNNDFLGSVSVYSMPTVSDVDSGWTLNGDTTGYGILADNPPVDATKYLSAAYPPPTPSTFGLGALPDNVTSIKCLMTMVRAAKTDGGDGNLQVSLVSGTDTADGTDRPITAAFTYWRDFFNQDPDTSAPWTVTAAEAALLKINRTV